jgi:L-alanine-DL-glutamate epimerase-like enolase superfamily enzyme
MENLYVFFITFGVAEFSLWGVVAKVPMGGKSRKIPPRTNAGHLTRAHSRARVGHMVIKISEVSARRVTVTLPRPVQLGEYLIKARGYCVTTVRLEDGSVGHAFGLDRGGPVAECVNTLIAPAYKEIFTGDPVVAWDALYRRASAPLSSGAALRGFSLVDLAAHEAVAKQAGKSVVAAFGKSEKKISKWAVIGYPPSRGPEEIEWEVRAAVAAGAQGVKLPVGMSPELTRERIIAALDTKLCPVSTDLAFSCRTAEEAMKIVGGLDLAWVEDPFVSGSLMELKKLRALLNSPLASGDDETHLYHPQAFVETGAVDILRIDTTCQGGLSRLLQLNDYLAQKKMPVSWHVYDAWHSQVASILDVESISIEYSAPGASVDALAELIVAREKVSGESSTTGWRFTLPELADEIMGIDSDPDWSALNLKN